MKALLYIVLFELFIFRTLSSQNYYLTYELRNKTEFPNDVPPELIYKVKEILEEKSKTIYLEKVSYKNKFILSKIDTFYYEKGFTNPKNIRTTRADKQYFFDGNKVYFINSTIHNNAYVIDREEISYQYHCDEKRVINGFECVKVTCTFLEEHFTLWVTDNSVFHGGPNVFINFPSLVVELSSDKKQYILKNMVQAIVTQINDDIIEGKKIFPISKLKWDLHNELKR
ncbi:MAG: hypothetical protein R2774_08450 [Saprospiraceae bacterium]